jgi:hypothetical protein
MTDITLETLGPQDAVKQIKSWENEDSYYSVIEKSTCSLANTRARPHPYLQTNEAKPTTQVVKVPVPIQGPIQIVYLDARSDAGLPHTRGKTGIALPIFYMWNPSEKTIQHELVHLSQKQYKDRWLSWYKKSWNFRIASETEFMAIPSKWRERRRINPDTLGYPYTIWSDRYIPLSVFLDELDPDLRKCKRGFWDLKMSQWTWEEPKGWVTLFGSGFNDEHPNEIAAHWIDGSAGPERAEVMKNTLI